MAEKQRLDLSTLEDLLPGDSLTIGKQVVIIRPLGIFKLALISKKLKSFVGELRASGISLENANTPENIIEIAAELLERFPEVLEEATNIHVDDIKQLPIEKIVAILDKVIEVNMKSNESFLGNFKSLANKILPHLQTNLEKETTPEDQGQKEG